VVEEKNATLPGYTLETEQSTTKDEKTVTKGGEAVELTAQEMQLLEILVRNRNIAVSRQRILHDAWGVSFFGETRTVDVHVQRLRKKLGLENRIKTIYKCGYRFEDRGKGGEP
jgi:DNA-binding response OmpR family regulator